LNRIRARISDFALRPASARPLAVLRIGVAAALIGEAALIAPQMLEYFGPSGIIQSPVSDLLARESLPSLGTVVRAFSSSGLSQTTAVRVAFGAYVLSLHLLLFGCLTRVAAIAAWLLFLSFKSSGSAAAYGAYEFAHIALFYCAVLPVGEASSVDAMRHPQSASAGARLGLRIIQIHLCIVYLASGLEKASGEQWWTGEAIWRALMRPGLARFDFGWLAFHPVIAMLAGWATLAVELGYAFFVWPKRTRSLWMALVVGLHLGIAVTLGLAFFSAVMITLNIAAFVADPEPVTRSSTASATGGSADLAGSCPTTAPP
jgi:hypothetical protein